MILVRGPERHQDPALAVEIAGLDVPAAQALHAELGRPRSELNVYRGQVLELTAGRSGMELLFAELPATPREDVVLPEAVLHRIERHTIAVARHREQLLAAAQHLKRGVLLFGPPGPARPMPPATWWASCAAAPF